MDKINYCRLANMTYKRFLSFFKMSKSCSGLEAHIDYDLQLIFLCTISIALEL